MLKPQILSDHEAVSQRAEAWIVERLHEQPDALLCLATGATPMRTYQRLAAQGAANPRLFNQVRLLKLDEWGGMPMNDPATCEQHLRTALVTPLNLTERYVAFDSQAADPHGECVRVAQWLAHNGPIDVSVLGLGVNGHVGFNEPAEHLEAHAHVARLSAASLSHTMLRDGGAPPSYGLTLGMADLLQSRHLLLLVTGPTKRGPLGRLLNGAISTNFPASFLTLHPSILVLCDEAALPRP